MHVNISLQNSELSLAVKTAGAELCSVIRMDDQTQYVWQADPNFWKRHAPVLFPIVGRLREDQYTWDGNTYRMTQHGFARDKEFQLVSQTRDRLVFELGADEGSKAVYPFDFRLRISYHLVGNTLAVHYEVENLSDTEMPFSIGGHPAFSCPIVPGETFEEYQIVFEQAEQADIHLLQGGLLDGTTEPYLQDSTRIPLTRETFLRDALVFKGLSSTKVKLLSQKSGRYLEMDMTGFPYFGIWSKPGAPFVCLEPWYGHADPLEAYGPISDKPGIILLKPSEAFQCQHSITFA